MGCKLRAGESTYCFVANVHLVVAITPHGFGHASQAAPVINSLQRQLAGLRVTVLSTIPESFIRSRIDGDFLYIQHAADFGLKMQSSMEIDLLASARGYKKLHADWYGAIDDECRFLEALEPDFILADVPYLSLAAGKKLALPVFALCSLNWADIYRHYFSTRPEAENILAQMMAAYQLADIFYVPEPAMPMPWLDSLHPVGPIARKGNNRREALLQQLNLPAGQRLVLVAPGGVATRLPIENWPHGAGISWLVADRFNSNHPDLYEIDEAQMSFTDILASVDLLLGKCGYGSVAECVVNGTPMLYMPRPDWPEEACLVDWMQQHNACLPVSKKTIESGDLLDVIEACACLEVDKVRATGAQQVADGICAHLKITTPEKAAR